MADLSVRVRVHCGFQIGTIEQVMEHARIMKLDSFVYVKDENVVCQYKLFDGKYREVTNGKTESTCSTFG